MYLHDLSGNLIHLFDDEMSAIQGAADGTIVYCGHFAHKVAEDFATVVDMILNIDNDGDTVSTTAVHSFLTESGHPDPAAALADIRQRDANLGQPDHDDAGRPVITPAVEYIEIRGSGGAGAPNSTTGE